MKKILIQFSSPGFAHNNIFNSKDINNAYVRWFELKRRLAVMGYELTTADDNNLTDCEGIIFYNADSLYTPPDLKIKIKNVFRKIFSIPLPMIYPDRKLYEEAVSAGLADKLLLIIWEARAVCAANFYPSTLAKFKRILTWDQDLLDSDQKFTRFYIPMESDEVTKNVIPFNQKKLLVNISFNKYASYKNDLYSERRKTIAFFDKYYPDDFDLFGHRWNRPITRLQQTFPFLVKNFKTFHGATMNKIDTLSRYKFNLCYENICDAKGYIADRIFSSFYAKAVPVYWGAPDIDRFVDSDTYIDRRRFKSEAELAEFLKLMTEEEHAKYISAATRYMKSEKFAKFSPENFCETIIKTLDLKNLTNNNKQS